MLAIVAGARKPVLRKAAPDSRHDGGRSLPATTALPRPRQSTRLLRRPARKAARFSAAVATRRACASTVA